MSFVHLHTHSEYSLIDGLPRISALTANAADKNFSAIALTDMHNLYAVIKFYTSALRQGIKPIIGCEVRLETNLTNEQVPCNLVLLCLHQNGYHNLMKLLSQSYLNATHSQAQVSYQQLQTYGEGLLVLSGGVRGDLGQALLLNKAQVIQETIAFWQKNFPGRYYIEIFRTGREHEELYSNLALEYALKHKLPIVATNDVRFLEEPDFDIHEARVCIASSKFLDDESRDHSYSNQQYLKTEAEMEKLFSDIPEALENAAEIAKRCTVRIETGKVLLPNFPLSQEENADKCLQREAREGLGRPGIIRADIPEEHYRQRLESELKIIADMGYAGYFLIVADFVRWAEQEQIPVGPGRGSGAGSLVAYVLGITKIDPLQYGLLFERFLNPERVSMPDFDIDFCMRQRDRVIDYVSKRYGSDKVSQIITFGSMAAKAVVRDVGRIQGHSYKFVDQIAKLIPNKLDITLDEALETSRELAKRYQDDTKVAAMIDIGKQLEGLVRNPGKHAGGVVIAPQRLTNYTALYCESGDQQSILTQCDMKDLEEIGLVKFDFLGLKTLTVIDKAIRTVNERSGKILATSDIPLDDPDTYRLLCEARTQSVFQLESQGVRNLLKKLVPDKFEDVVSVMALYRPGPLKGGVVANYVKRKHGGEVSYPHPLIEDILKPTYGIILYQEQIMQIARKMSGYSLGGADLLRRAMGKKLKIEMAQQREKFNAGAEHNQVPRKTANEIFEFIEKFSGYGFNRSHSVGYGLVTYWTAWLKVHYPAEFMAAVLSTDMRFTDKVVETVYECYAMDITVLPPDINVSQWEFEVHDDKTICYGLGAIRNVGMGAVNEIIDERKANGCFKSLHDFCMRMVPRNLKVSILQSLLTAGAMDQLGTSRARMLADIDTAMAMAEQKASDTASGQTNLFGNTDAGDEAVTEIAAEAMLEYSDLLKKEKESLGFYMSHHPLDGLQEEIVNMVGTRLYDIYCSEKSVKQRFVGIVSDVIRKHGSGFQFFFILDDGRHHFRFALFGDLYQEYKDILKVGEILVVNAKTRFDSKQEVWFWRVNEILTWSQACESFAKSIYVKVDSLDSPDEFIQALHKSIKPYIAADGCTLRIAVSKQGIQADLVLGENWKVKACEQMLNDLRRMNGVRELTVIY